MLDNRLQLPPNQLALLAEHPRKNWEDNPEIPIFILQWLETHALFRRLSSTLVKETQKFLAKERNAPDYAQRLGFFGAQLVDNLTRHHHFEDEQFFPSISTTEPRVEASIDMLIADHATLTQALERFVIAGNELIDLAMQGDEQAFDKAKEQLQQAKDLQAFLASHLTDEEDLIIPILLHHKLAD